MSDISDIIDQLEHNYPLWLVEGLAQSPQVKNIEKALITLAGTKADMSKASKAVKDQLKTTKQTTESLEDFDQTVGNIKESFDKTVKSTDDVSKAHGKLSKALGVIYKGNLFGTKRDLFHDIKDYGKSFGLLSIGASLLSDALSRAIEIIVKNNASYSKLAQSGFRINDAFVGISKAAISANLSLEDFTQLAVDNASVLAQWGPQSAKDLGLLSYSIRKNRDIMGRFGFDISEVNDYLTDYLGAQQRLGFLNKVTQKQLND